MENIDDLTLFLINFAEKKYPCATYLNKPLNARDIMTNLAQGDITNLQGLKQIVMSKEIPRNDNFVQLYKKPTESSDLVFSLKGTDYRCH